MKKRITQVVTALSLAIPMETFSLVSESTGKNPKGLQKFLDVPGARVTTGVGRAKESYSNEFIEEARENFNNFHLQMGGDHTLYYNAHLSEFMPSSISAPSYEYMPLEFNLDKRIESIKVQTGQGELTLEEYTKHPMFRLEGAMMIHKGKVVYQAYPGMTPTSQHVWMSAAKSTVGLVLTQLVVEEKIDPNAPITKYVPELKGTNWDTRKVIDVANQSSGLDIEETGKSILNPDSEVVRFFSSIFGAPNPSTGKVEEWIEVAKGAENLEGEKPGEHFRYSSLNTMVIIQMIENIEEKPWAELFEERVWGKLGARQPMVHSLTPEGTALPLGLVSSTLEDFAKFGMLFTPSWNKVATEQVVTEDILNVIYSSKNREAFEGSAKADSALGLFNEPGDAVSYQFDIAFDDGALYKSGNLGQGIYIDPERDFVGVYFSTNPYVDGFGEIKMPAYMRKAAIELSGK